MIRCRKLTEAAYLTKLIFKKSVERELVEEPPEYPDGPSKHYWEEYEVNEATESLGGIIFTFSVDEGSLWVQASSPKYVNPIVGIMENPSKRQKDFERLSMNIWKDLNDAYEEISLDKDTIREIFSKHHLNVYR